MGRFMQANEALTALVATVLLFATCCHADGKSRKPVRAQCEQVIPGVTPGGLQCHPSQTQAHPGGTGYCKKTDSQDCFTSAAYMKECNPDWYEKKAFSCPDGIGPDGVFHSNKCFSWCAPHIYKGTLQGCDASSKQCGKAAVMKAGSQSSVLLLHKRVKCGKEKDSNTTRCSVYKSSRCLDVGEKVFSSPWDSDVKHSELQIAAEKAAHILRKSRTCSLITPFVPRHSDNKACTAQSPCVANGHTCRGLDQPVGDGGCNRFCNRASFRGDLGGCIKDACKCLTEKACADSWVKRDNVCGTQCKHWSRPMYTESNGWSGEIVISDAHRCKTAVNIPDVDTWNDVKFAKDKTILY